MTHFFLHHPSHSYLFLQTHIIFYLLIHPEFPASWFRFLSRTSNIISLGSAFSLLQAKLLHFSTKAKEIIYLQWRRKGRKNVVEKSLRIYVNKTFPVSISVKLRMGRTRNIFNHGFSHCVWRAWVQFDQNR